VFRKVSNVYENNPSEKVYLENELTLGNTIELEALLMTPTEMKNAGYPIHPLHDDGFADADVVCTPDAQDPNLRKTVIGLDCEMCLTAQGSEITRVTLVDFQGNTLYDELVKPENPIIDYLTTYPPLILLNWLQMVRNHRRTSFTYHNNARNDSSCARTNH
jgi:hypothetical protein